ncbi:hypothetical protein EAE99_000814 [Botrytis elliptica]|nr:hypothetical protein EAE99_000814 [Botrytis elliptica]
MLPITSVWLGGVSILIFLSCFYFLLWAVKDVRYRLAARKAGCAMPVKYWHKDPFLGVDLFFQRLKDMNSGDSLATDRIILGKYGKTVLTNNWGTKQYMTMDPIVIQTVLALEVDKFGVAPMNHPMCSPLLGEGIMTVDGHAWKKSRSLLNLVFTKAQVSELSSLEAHVKIFMDLIPRDGTTIDMQPLCKKLFLDISSEFVFGKSANSLSPEKSSTVGHRLVHLFDEALVKMFQRYMLGRFKFLIGEKKWFAQCAEVQGIVDELIDAEFKNQAAAAKGSEVQTDIPYNHVLLKELVKMTDDRRYIRDELMNVFFPARDTAGILMGNIIFMLARHPQVWAKLRKEVLDIGDQKLTFELLKSLKYVQAVINETLRLQSPVGGSWKTCLVPCILPHGGGPSGKEPILVEPGDEMRMSFTPLHTDPNIWGETALDFLPERWAGLKQSWNYIPFMGGRRICPAQQNALTDVAFVLATLARNFKVIENRGPHLEYVDKIVFTRECADGVQIAFVPI